MSAWKNVRECKACGAQLVQREGERPSAFKQRNTCNRECQYRSVSMTKSVPIEERFWSKVDKNGPNGCWEWTAAKSKGYGHVRCDGRWQAAYRVAYELLVGPIPEGLHVDHLCRNPACVNPSHLEPVTLAENTRRGFSPPALAARQELCVNGHPFDRVDRRGQRVCSVCSRSRIMRHHARNRRAAEPGVTLSLQGPRGGSWWACDACSALWNDKWGEAACADCNSPMRQVSAIEAAEIRQEGYQLPAGRRTRYSRLPASASTREDGTT